MGGVRRIISPPKPQKPPAPVYVPAPSQAEVSQAQSTSMQQLARGRGRSSTILTGPKGLGDGNVSIKKSLLGG
ncbi:hypothetical protein [uncultured Mediterranean phage uvMED]|nr:hypothetical protein [uncultured Mediterranean phage uvMED]